MSPRRARSWGYLEIPSIDIKSFQRTAALRLSSIKAGVFPILKTVLMKRQSKPLWSMRSSNPHMGSIEPVMSFERKESSSREAVSVQFGCAITLRISKNVSRRLRKKSPMTASFWAMLRLRHWKRRSTMNEACGEIETAHPGYLGSQDTFYVGNLKGVGRIYQQTFVDTYSKVAFAKLYTTKTPITAADILNDKVLPYFEQYALPMLRILTDRGTEYCGRVDHHDYQLYLAINDIDHTKTKAMHPKPMVFVSASIKPYWMSFIWSYSVKKCIQLWRNCKKI